MKYWKGIIGCAMLGWTAACMAGGPAPFSIERYQALMSRSAFAPAAEVVAVTAGADFAKDLVLTGVVRLNGGEFVSMVTRDQKRQFGLFRGETRDGMSIAGVAWADTPGRTRVTLKKGGEYAVIGFDEAAAFAGPTAAGQAQPGAAPQPLPGKPPMPLPHPPRNPAPRLIAP